MPRSVTARLSEPCHSRNLAKGIETDSHGPVFNVELERGSDGVTRLWAQLEAMNLSADQAEVFGMALIRAAYVLRAEPDASHETRLNHYWDGKSFVDHHAVVLEPTPAPRSLKG